MILFEEAFRIVLSHAIPAGTERIPFTEASGRILAEDIFSDLDMPPFNKSAVDGYACRKNDLPGKLKVIEIIPAGKVPEKTIQPGECSKVMTGGMVPSEADCVIMVEDTENLDNDHIRYTKEKTPGNICYKGEDIRSGDKVLSKGTRLFPQHIAVLATVGAVDPLVSGKIRLGILSTGNELVEPGKMPAGSQIRNSNSWQLLAQAAIPGIIPFYSGIAEDNEDDLHKKLLQSLETNDIVILSGGVSMGDFDYVPHVMESLGIQILVKSIAIQPGRPTVFGIKGNKFIFGLPGNPVSSFVLFEILVKPFLFKMMGLDVMPIILKLPMGVDYNRKKSNRKSLVPVRFIDSKVFPVEYHGSANINAYTLADGFLILEPGEFIMKEGELANVRPL
ncbi:MAG: molybdopterin molybdotransferase MoeA [Bacteroidota bacterium]|nr:molybdopterin molybdotransferase MoeA [Bacteroidota bacterium]